jgi:hypothetical protein
MNEDKSKESFEDGSKEKTPRRRSEMRHRDWCSGKRCRFAFDRYSVRMSARTPATLIAAVQWNVEIFIVPLKGNRVQKMKIIRWKKTIVDVQCNLLDHINF